MQNNVLLFCQLHRITLSLSWSVDTILLLCLYNNAKVIDTHIEHNINM